VLVVIFINLCRDSPGKFSGGREWDARELKKPAIKITGLTKEKVVAFSNTSTTLFSGESLHELISINEMKTC